MDATLIYDGDCAFCTAQARNIAARWREPATAVAWQQLSDERLRELGLSIADVTTAAWWVSPSGSTVGGHLAVARALQATSGWRRVAGHLIASPALGWLAAPAYRAVAKHRHRLPGGTDACKISSTGE